MHVRGSVCRGPQLAIALLALTGCGPDDDTTAAATLPPDGGGEAECVAGERPLDSGSCEPAGLPTDAPCAPGETPLDDGACVPAGIPPDGCAAGFAFDGERSCDPVLPADPCPAGLVAWLGEGECHELASCGDGPWGHIPVEPTTEHVDGSYVGTDSDGSAARPWPTIGQAVAAAADGAIVAVAAGSYVEDVTIQGKAVRLWGRCPALVEIVGSATDYGALFVDEGADGTEIRSLAVTGESSGLVLGASEELLVDSVWVHDTGHRGIDAENAFGPLSVRVESTLVERAASIGLLVLGAAATLDRVAVRDTQPGAQGPLYGAGIAVSASPYDDERADVTIRGALLDHNRDRGLSVVGSSVRLEASVIRDTQPKPDGLYGRGLELYPYQPTLARSAVTVRGCIVERNHEAGMLAVGSDLTVQESVIRHTLSSGEKQSSAIGIVLWPPETVGVAVDRTTATIERSVLEDNALVGIFVVGSVASIDSTIVRDMRPWGYDDSLGRGLDLEDSVDSGKRSEGTVRWSVFERNYETNVSVMGSDAIFEGCVVRDTFPQQSDGILGRGLNVQLNPVTGQRANATIRGSLLERNRDVSLAIVGSEAIVEQSVVRDTAPRRSDDRAGRGIQAQREPDSGERALLTMRGVLVERSREVGVGIAGAEATIEWSRIAETQPQQLDEFGGDGVDVQRLGADTSAWIEWTRIETSSRAGLASFGASVALGHSRLDCNPIHLDGERWEEASFSFRDLSRNECGCDDEQVYCQVLSANLEPPEPL